MLGRAQFVDVTDGIGLSVGAANLTAVHVGQAAVRRTAVLTRYPNRPPEVGVPSENPNLAERGLILTDFVDRVGDPVAIVAPDGSSHRAEVVMADALGALFHTLVGGRPSAEPVGVAYPAHWRPAAVETLRGALGAIPEFQSPTPALLVSDATAALIALQQEPGLPARGVIAVCDFGGTGTSITLADAANGFAPVGPTVRYHDLSGDLIDQALLTTVIADLSAAGSIDLAGTSAIGSLTKLRAQCRAAKERLSTASVTSLTADLSGAGRELRVTRNELDEAIRAPLAGFVDELTDTLHRNGVRAADLVAVASVGGGARIPIITTTLSEHLRVPVVTAGQPELAAAIGSGLRAVRGTVVEGATSMAPLPAAAVVPVASEAPMSSTFRALAWSDADDVPDVAPADDYVDDFRDDGSFGDPGEVARPQLAFEEPDPAEREAAAPLPWYRQPVVIAGLVLFVALAAIAAAIMVALRSGESPAPEGTSTSATPTPTTATTTSSEAAPAPPATSAPPATAPPTVTRRVPPPVVTVTQEPPASEPPPPSEPPPSEPPPSEPPPPPSEPPPSTQPPLIPTLPYETIPGLPFVPAPIQPPPP